MRHYEVILLVHPEQSDKIPEMIDRYTKTITEQKGIIHRLENWGRKALAYPIKNTHKAHYVMMNIECTNQSLSELTEIFRYSDAVIRTLVIKKDKAITEASIMVATDTKENTSQTKDDDLEEQY